MKCERMDELLSALADDELDAREALVVERHLQGCRACREKARRLSALKGAVRRAAAEDAPDGLKDALFAAAGRRRAAAPAPARPAPWALAPRWGLAAAFAAAAVAVVVVARPRDETVPLDFMLAAHDAYAMTMPLAPVEALTPDLAERLASQGDER